MNSESNLFSFFRWLGGIIYLWVKSQLLPKDETAIKAELGEGKICYVLRTRSLSDLLVLDYHCRKAGLPRPLFTKNAVIAGDKKAFYLYLKKMGLVTHKPAAGVPKPLTKVCDQVAKSEFDVRYVPVSVFWGRQPSKEDPGLLKLMFFDDEYGGIWQRFLAMIIHGRQVFCHVGKSISVKQSLEETSGSLEAAQKIHRLLKVQFQRDRLKVIGPQIYDLSQMMEEVVSRPSVKAAILETNKKKKQSIDKLEAYARRYFYEITAKQNYSTIRLLDRFLGWLWQKVYEGVEVQNIKAIQNIDGSKELVFMPCHRSHIDYLLLSYILFANGYKVPHIAAGINLNFWPIGSVLRRGGAFFIRRTFGGNRVYSEVFHEYVCYLMKKGFPVQFFAEGGRSRTGKLLKPKTGMLSMVVEGQRRLPSKDVMIIPTYISYDRVVEAKSYQKELGGRKKTGESFFQLLSAAKIIGKKYGKAYVSFGEPIDLRAFLSSIANDENGIDATEDAKKPEWFYSAVNSLSSEVMTRINKAATVPEAAVFSTLLLSSPNNALTEDQLIDLTLVMQKLLVEMKAFGPEKVSTRADLKKSLRRIETLLQWQRFSNPAGDVVYAKQSHVLHLTYYRNNIAHWLLIPGVFGQLMHLHRDISRTEAKTVLRTVYNLNQKDLFLPVSETEQDDFIEGTINGFEKTGLIKVEGENLIQPEVGEDEFFHLRSLARISEPFTQPVAMAIYCLGQLVGKEVPRKKFEESFESFRQRLLILKGGDSLSALYQNFFKIFSPMALSNSWVSLVQSGEIWEIQGQIEEVSNLVALLLNEELRVSLKRMSEQLLIQNHDQPE